MKKLLLTISILFIVITLFGQGQWNLNFENDYFTNRVVIDTITSSNNIWRIGHPSKTIFNTAFSSPNVIVTDTLNSYPVNDTSSFTIIHIAGSGWHLHYPKVDIGGWYYVNSDSLTDFGYIEFSSDKGNTWLHADSSDNNGCCSWGASQELPIFYGNSNGWKHFYYCLCTSGVVNMGDTILYRFTFISDSIQSNKDGLMFDNLNFEDWSEGIKEIQNNNLISIYPNPVSAKLKVQYTKRSSNQSVQIHDYIGQVIYKNQDFIGETIDTRQLTNGVYFLKYSDTKNYAIKKFIVIH